MAWSQSWPRISLDKIRVMLRRVFCRVYVISREGYGWRQQLECMTVVSLPIKLSYILSGCLSLGMRYCILSLDKSRGVVKTWCVPWGMGSANELSKEY